MLSNWLNSVKNNNVNLYDTFTGSNLAETLLSQSMNGAFGIGGRGTER